MNLFLLLYSNLNTLDCSNLQAAVSSAGCFLAVRLGAHSMIFVLTVECDLFLQRGCFWMRPLARRRAGCDGSACLFISRPTISERGSCSGSHSRQRFQRRSSTQQIHSHAAGKSNIYHYLHFDLSLGGEHSKSIRIRSSVMFIL